MATLVLGTVGRIYGGPLGAIVGSAVGGAIDRSILGDGGSGRDIGRLGNLAVQSAAYGEPIPFITGRMRVAGNLIWSSGITEMSTRSGGGKSVDSANSTYSYSASFAVGLAARKIAAIGRVWADGRLIRNATGAFLTPIEMRLHLGDEDQAPDPLIAAFEGPSGAPAYRGMAVAVFEDLPLAGYGNRIPNLTFEVIADAEAAHDAGVAIEALAAVNRRQLLTVEGSFPAISGHFSGRSGSLAAAIAPLAAIGGAAIAPNGRIVVRGEGGVPITIPEDDAQARAPGDLRPMERQRFQGGETLAAGVEIAFFDTSRDYQPGLQRVRRDIGGSIEQQTLACSMSPDEAKTMATSALARATAARLRSTIRLPWRYLALQPGAQIVIGDAAGTVWRVREARFENFVVSLDIERVRAGTIVAMQGDGGRAVAFNDVAAGETTIVVLDLPALPGELPTAPRLLIAAAGASPGWRRSAIEVSGDGGVSYVPLGIVEGGAVLGVALTALVIGSVYGWDRFGSVDIELLSDAMWLEGRSKVAVLAGGNIAILGDEIVQFAVAEALSPRRFRLSGLLRGRRGTEQAISTHEAGERFVLLDTPAMLAFDPPLEAIGRAYRFRATGVGDRSAVPIIGCARGKALAPLAPAHLQLSRRNGDILVNWKRRSRSGFGWPDFVDAPLGESSEAYRVEVLRDGILARQATVTMPQFFYSLADQVEDSGGDEVTIFVSQISAAVGPGEVVSATIRLV